MAIKYLDVRRLKVILTGGGAWLAKHEDLLNELNVYPVPDGDTGSNMTMTINSMINEINDNITEKSSMPQLIEVVEEAVLMGARGNSGTILSQVITGFLRGIGNKTKLFVKDVAEALVSAKNVAYQAVSEPIEGTMLTVIRKIAEKAEECADKTEDLVVLLKEITKAAELAVEDTPNLLPKLKEAGVVDAGGKGLFFLFEGFYKVATELNVMAELQKSQVKENEFDKVISNIDHDPDSINFQYCTEYIILNGEFDTEEYKRRILDLGDSVVFAQTSKKFKTHIHTNNPGLAMEIALEYGALEKIKIENMKLQHDNLHFVSEKDEAKLFVNKKANRTNTGYIILADSEGLKEEYLKLGADIVILGGQSKNPSVQEILDAITKLEKKNIYVLPNNKNVITTAKLAAEKSGKNVLVCETRTMLEGHFYLKNNDEDFEDLRNLEKGNYSIEITKAVRDTTVDELIIEKDNYIGLVNGKIKYTNGSLRDLVNHMLAELVTENTLVATVVEGKDSEKDATGAIKEKLGHVKTNYIVGNQENYNYYIYLENRDANMPEVAIVTDSVSDLLDEDIKGLPIKIVPLKVDIDGQFYKEGVEISKEQFWHRLLNENVDVKTSQPAPQEILNVYNKLFERGYKKIISIHISSKLSGTLQAARVAKTLTNRENDIELVDGMGVTLLQGTLVLEAAKKAVKGESLESIVNWTNSHKNKGKLLVVIPSLKYLEKGGRIGKASAAIGGLLQMKPVLTINQGEMSVETKVISDKRALKYIEKYIRDESKKQSIVVSTAWGGTSKEIEAVSKLYHDLSGEPKIKFNIVNRQIGAVIGAHAGPVYGVVIYPKLG